MFVFALFGSSSLFVQSVFRARLVWTGGPLLLAILMSKTLILLISGNLLKSLNCFVLKLQHFARFHCRWEWDTFCHVGVVVGFGRSKGTSGPVECTSSSLLKGSHPRKVGGVISGTIVPSGGGSGGEGAKECN